MQINKEDRLPKWVFFTIAIVVTFLLVGGLKYFWDDYQKEPVSYKIGKFNDVKMDEKIDNNWNNGVQKTYGFSDIIPAHPPFEIVQHGNSKEIQVLLKLNIEPSGRMTIHCNWESCNIRNATNYIYDTLMEDNYQDNQTVKIMVNNGYTVFNGTVYDLRG